MERARELFEALDVDGDGVVTEGEFIKGCMRDGVFVMLLQKFNGEEVYPPNTLYALSSQSLNSLSSHTLATLCPPHTLAT